MKKIWFAWPGSAFGNRAAGFHADFAEGAEGVINIIPEVWQNTFHVCIHFIGDERMEIVGIPYVLITTYKNTDNLKTQGNAID
jgi:hypothetical protein